ncbi:MAG TPA: GPR1/FUN34/YaaH family transporter [Acidimicrobiales bacterium]|nr:GPR1/FUN34/YaaH family transporter [Acidimicrobiales bacterium]
MAAQPMDEYTPRQRGGAVTELSEHEVWEHRARVVLSPVAAPSILGLFGFAAATLIVASNLAGWWGGTTSGLYLAPFALAFGGIAQFLAGMWSYKARDGLATAMHGMWGSFWIGWGLLELLMGTHAIPTPATAATYFPALGMWFVMLGLLTGLGAFAAIPRGAGMVGTLGCLSAGSCLLAVAFITGNLGIREAGGWVLVASVGFAIYTAAALMFAEAAGGRTVLPLGKAGRDANVPGGFITRPIQYPEGMPGVKVGQ